MKNYKFVIYWTYDNDDWIAMHNGPCGEFFYSSEEALTRYLKLQNVEEVIFLKIEKIPENVNCNPNTINQVYPYF